MTKEQTLVKEFMRMFNQKCPDKPVQLDEETAKLRAALILEEAFETITKGLGLRINISQPSVKNSEDIDWIEINPENIKTIDIDFCKEKEVDLVELADGLADIHYVAYCGTACAAGIDMEPIFKNVDDSNKTKMWTEEQLEKAKELYPTAKVENYGGGLYRLIRDDGKIIKSPNYQAATPAKFIEEQLNANKNQLDLNI